MKLYMKQKVFSWTSKFTIRDENESDRYAVQGDFFTLGKRLHVYDSQGVEVALIQQKLLSLLGLYIIFIDGEEICRVARRFSLLKPEFELEGGPGWIMKGDFWAHEYTLSDGEAEIMTMHKHWFSWGDSYEMNIVKPQDELMCLCVALAVDASMESKAAAGTSPVVT